MVPGLAPMPLPEGDLAGRRFVLFDGQLNGEIHGTVVERAEDAASIWHVRLDEGPEPGLSVWIGARGDSHLGRWLVVREADHPADALFRTTTSVEPYPPGAEAVRTRIVGTAFFPGGSGLWRERVKNALPRWPVGGVMVLGQDFHSRTQYERSLKRGVENLDAPTWKGVRALLSAVDIAEEACFFTNAFMGLRTGKTSHGPHAAMDDGAFAARCRTFLAEQLRAQRPRVILALGLPAARLLGGLSPAALAGWADARSFKALDESGVALVREVAFPAVPDVVAHVAALVHPSFGRLNVGRRRYERRGERLEGEAAERALVDDAMDGLGTDRWT